MALWVALFKIKIKVIKIKTLIHDFSLKRNIKHIGSGMSRGNFDSLLCSGARFLKSDVSIRANHRESLGFGLRAKGLTFHENPFSIAKIQL